MAYKNKRLAKVMSQHRTLLGAANWFSPRTESWIFQEDVGSAFDQHQVLFSSQPEFLGSLSSEAVDTLIWLQQNTKSNWEWLLAFEKVRKGIFVIDIVDSRICLVTRFFLRSDAILYRLSRKAIPIKSFDTLERVDVG